MKLIYTVVTGVFKSIADVIGNFGTILKGVFTRVLEDFPNFTLNDIVLHNMENDQVLATLRYKGNAKSTGKELNAQAAHLWTIKDGKIIAFQQYADTKQLNDVVR